MSVTKRPLFDPPIVRRAMAESLVKLDPRHMVRNPVMFVVLLGSAATTLVLLRDLAAGNGPVGFTLQICLWLWFTVMFANFAEAMAEGRGKAQADSLRSSRTQTSAKRVKDLSNKTDVEMVAGTSLKRGDLVLAMPGDVIPGDGEVVEGVASVDESAITGESAPVIRESGGDRSAVTGGTKVLSDYLVIRITANPGETFLDRMIALVEGASRQKTPNEIALTILLSGLTIIFLFAVATLQPFALYSGTSVSIPVLVALLVCLIPTTIGGLLSAIGIAGMDRMIQQNVIAMSGRAVEAAGDVNTLLLDKTGTITLGNRQAVEFIPVPGIRIEDLADRAQLASLPDETPEGRSIVVLAKNQFNLRGRPLSETPGHDQMTFVPFSATTRMSGVGMRGMRLRKGAGEAHLLRQRGIDVVVGFIETHGRVETAAQLGDLEIVSRRQITYRGVVLEEMDTDAVIARRPNVAIVDELAHTNVPGTARAKRWEDVVALLDEGISVISAVNVQHLESLNDVIQNTLGVTVRETIPDWVITLADQVVNLDISAEDLRQRLIEGKIYSQDNITTALKSFFTEENLATLRELALREVASSVDRAREEKTARVEARPGSSRGSDRRTVDRVLVGMSSHPEYTSFLLRKASRIAGRLNPDWYCVYVQTPAESASRIDATVQRKLVENIQRAQAMGADVVQLESDDIARALCRFAVEKGVTLIIVGQSRHSWWQRIARGSVIERLQQRCGN